MNSDATLPLHAFAGYGIELEYMIVERDSLSVLPIADRLLRNANNADNTDSGYEVERGAMGWSNELVLHVVEVKNRQPAESLGLLREAFQGEVMEINRRLESLGARLMPGAMHPWMNPLAETRLWPHDNEAIYRIYDRIFDSRSHGWANLQSMHINLPFADDEEFARLHAAIRLVLPILPALAASSPLADGRITGFADFRMHAYAGNADGIPSIAGMIVPETVSSRADYEQRILAPMYRDIAPHDPEGVLRHEWLNSRGAIARFDRNAIEIRVIDTQECPHADLAVAAATVDAVRRLYEAPTLAEQQDLPTTMLADVLRSCMRDAEQAVIAHPAYLALMGYPGRECSAGELWQHLIGRMMDGEAADPPERDHWAQWSGPLQTILRHGPLARRILRDLGHDQQARMGKVYAKLCDCLQEGSMFLPDATIAASP
ncbi:glutamate-cysteine ligase family protein [Noviherbaspirillum sp. CPCC 100848]|uniref:Glutamate-cysteine ligase family protein n=1 Tax=Noviherbaspirillum album TaxID=3080276 RepID=A0ABU6J7E5_9BURK|nr:glutamate-cysteine ligase family protein [Noviherbaspirillum sp. CPCC 100848]MEC4719569.1 glutamate-cysteine ligase family protein [Noviherbaspirillum sp. CPCC 100848]